MDFTFIAGIGFVVALLGANKVYETVEPRGKVLARGGALAAFLAIFVLAGVVAEYVVRRECEAAHVPWACVADQLDPNQAD